MRKWMIEITKEDVMNIAKWMTSASILIEAGVRIPYSDSEHSTWNKLQPIYNSSEQSAKGDRKK